MKTVILGIRVVGKIAGEKNKADKLVKDMTSRINDVQSAVKDVENKSSVLFALWLNPVYTCGNDTFLSRIIYLAGGVNVFADLSGWPTVSLEEIVTRKPDVILVTATMMGEKLSKQLSTIRKQNFQKARIEHRGVSLHLVLKRSS